MTGVGSGVRVGAALAACAGLALASWRLVVEERGFETRLDWIPAWIAQAVMPVSFALVAHLGRMLLHLLSWVAR